jgi:hypothetical protein
MPATIKVFRYLEELDAFVVTPEYDEIARTLGLWEWSPVVWIGRLFILDNDYGEHWFDNWDLREEKGLDESYFLIDPWRFENSKDGPCHTAEFRKRFWTDVLKSLELSLDLLFDEARAFNERDRELMEQYPEHAWAEDYIPDLEDRIQRLRERFGPEASGRAPA